MLSVCSQIFDYFIIWMNLIHNKKLPRSKLEGHKFQEHPEEGDGHVPQLWDELHHPQVGHQRAHWLHLLHNLEAG